MRHPFVRSFALILVLACLFCAGPKSESSPDDPQKLVDIVDERITGNTFALTAVSKVDYPVTVNVDLPTLENLKANSPPPYSVVVQPKRRTQITKLFRVNARMATRYASVYTCYAGWRDDKAKEFVYTLPWEPGYAYRIGQGFNGEFSYQGKNALDFNMPEGATICAVRDGQVIEVTQNFSDGGIAEELKDKANRILILHDDGTLARYAHLLHNGAKVKIGQRVKAGEAIGLVGATGYAKGPHLHFELDRPPKPGENQYDTMTMQFEAVNGKGDLERISPGEGQTLQRPGARGGSATNAPPNTIDEIVFCRDVKDGKPIGADDIFRADMQIAIVLKIGAPAERKLRLIIQRDDNNAQSPRLFDQELPTKSDTGLAWITMKLAEQPSLRGRLVLRVLVEKDQVGEKRFRVN